MSDKPQVPERWADKYEHWIINREARQLAEELGAAEAKVRELEQALQRYATHDTECTWFQKVDRGPNGSYYHYVGECNCGLAALHVADKAVKS